MSAFDLMGLGGSQLLEDNRAGRGIMDFRIILRPVY